MSEQEPTPDGDRSPRMDRLPPPAFPPGHRRRPTHRARGADREDGDAARGFPEGAFFSPDAPIRRSPATAETGVETEGGKGQAEVESVAGSGEEPSPTPRVLRAAEIAMLLEALATEVRALRGGRFRWKPDAAPLEAALRGVLSGYLKGGEAADRGG